MAMERVTVEQNGERFTLEVPEGTSDEQITSFLTQQNQPTQQTPMMPAPATYYPGQTGMAQLGKEVAGAAQPLTQAGKSIVSGYATSPGKAIVDVGAAHLGLPPPYAGYEAYQGVKNLFGAAKQTASNLGEVLSKLPAGTEQAAKPFIDSLNPSDLNKLSESINKYGLRSEEHTSELQSH